MIRLAVTSLDHVTCYGTCLVVRGRASVTSEFGPIGDEEITQVDGVPTPFESADTTPIPRTTMHDLVYGDTRRVA